MMLPDPNMLELIERHDPGLVYFNKAIYMSKDSIFWIAVGLTVTLSIWFICRATKAWSHWDAATYKEFARYNDTQLKFAEAKLRDALAKIDELREIKPKHVDELETAVQIANRKLQEENEDE